MAVKAAHRRARVLPAHVMPVAFAAGLIVCLGTGAVGYEPDSAANARLVPIAAAMPAILGNIDTNNQHAAEPPASFTPRAQDSPLWQKWRAAEAAIAADRATLARCRAEPQSCRSLQAVRFNAIVDAARMRAGRARIGEINRAINLAIKAVPDAIRHGIADVWSPPLDTFAAGAGDCEDYAIAKYAALREAEIASADLRLLIVRNDAMRQDHAVLAVRHEGRWLILDNRRMAMVEDRHFDLRPLFAFDRDGVRSLVPALAASGAQGSRSGNGVPLPL